MKLWLDDERDPKEPFIQENFGATGDEFWVKTVSSAVRYLMQGNITSISFDHDLGYNGTGLDVAKWIEEEAFYGRLQKLDWFIHSKNEVGAKNIEKAMRKAESFWSKND